MTRTRVEDMPDVGEEAAELMGMALEPSTWQGRAVHMRAVCLFMEKTSRDFPLDERALVAFLGFLYSCMVTKSGPQLRARSVPSYLSGIRLTHDALGLGELPKLKSSLRLGAAFAGYEKVSDRVMPATEIRISIPAAVLYGVLAWAARSRATKRDRRDAALLITATVFGLRAAGIQSVLYEQTELTDDRLQVLVGSLKGRTLQAALRRGGRSFHNPSPVAGHPLTVLGLMRSWLADRGVTAGPLFDGAGLNDCDLDAATKRLMRSVGFNAPAGCAVRGHSPRITAFSQAVLMRWSDVRLRIRFDWKNLADMVDVYFDHRARLSAASLVFFSPELPEPVMQNWEGEEEGGDVDEE